MKGIEKEWEKTFKGYLNTFVVIEDSEWEKFSKRLSVVKLKKKSHFITPLDTGIKFAFIVKGVLRTYFVSEKGTEYTTDFCKEGEISVNDKVYFPHINNSYSQALDDSILLVFSYSDILNLEKENDIWGKLKSNIMEHYYPIKMQREKDLLSLNAEEKYHFFVNKYCDILDKIPQYLIASYLGITPIALSRVVNKLNKNTN